MFQQTFLPVGFQIFGKLIPWHFNSLLIPGYQTEKIKGSDGGIPTLQMQTIIYVKISCSIPVFN